MRAFRLQRALSCANLEGSFGQACPNFLRHSQTSTVPALSSQAIRTMTVEESPDQDLRASDDTTPEGDQADVRRQAGMRTTCYFRGYKHTKAWDSRRRIVFRCSRYRSKKCKGTMHFTIATMGYSIVRPHICRIPEVDASLVDARPQIKEFVDGLALSNLSLSANAIWSRVQAQFYSEDNDTVAQGLNEQQVISREYRMRRQNYGGDVHGMIEIPPLSLVKGLTMPFFQFHVVTPNEDPSKPPNRIVGWAHPKLLNLLRCPGVSLFVDGTFRCVPPSFFTMSDHHGF